MQLPCYDSWVEFSWGEKEILDIFLTTINRFQRKSTFSTMPKLHIYVMIQVEKTLIGLDSLKNGLLKTGWF